MNLSDLYISNNNVCVCVCSTATFALELDYISNRMIASRRIIRKFQGCENMVYKNVANGKKKVLSTSQQSLVRPARLLTFQEKIKKCSDVTVFFQCARLNEMIMKFSIFFSFN